MLNQLQHRLRREWMCNAYRMHAPASTRHIVVCSGVAAPSRVGCGVAIAVAMPQIVVISSRGDDRSLLIVAAHFVERRTRNQM